jgi:hypothetical protein
MQIKCFARLAPYFLLSFLKANILKSVKNQNAQHSVLTSYTYFFQPSKAKANISPASMLPQTGKDIIKI